MSQQQQNPGQFQLMLRALLIAFLVFYAWMFISNKFHLFPKPPATQPAASTQEGATGQSPTTNKAGESGTATRPTTASGTQTAELGATAVPSAGLKVAGGTDDSDVTLGSAEHGSEFPMALVLSPHGASIKQATLRGFYQTVKSREPYVIFKPFEEPTSARPIYSLETSKIYFSDLEQKVELGSVIWQKDLVTREQVVFSAVVEQADGKPLARVKKTYTLHPQPSQRDKANDTYDLLFDVNIENLTNTPFHAALEQQGPVGFQQEDPQQEDRQVVSAMFDPSHANGFFAKGRHRRDKDFTASSHVPLGRDEELQRIAWVAQANQFFTCIMAPSGRYSNDDAVRFSQAYGVRLTDRIDSHYSDDLTFQWVTAPIKVEPRKSQDISFDTYIGPKSKTSFQTIEAYKLRHYYNVITVNFYSCAPTALVSVMMSLLNTFHRIPPHNYGIAIFLLVVLVRLILHPITKRSQINMMKMQKQMATLQPKLQAAKAKYANDRNMLNQETMKIYQEAGVNPAGSILSCIPMMLQIPIWGALWQALRSTVEMRHAGLDGWWINDLSRPDAIISLPESMHFTVPIFGMSIVAVNLLPILLAITQLLQAKYMPRAQTAVAADGNPDSMEQQRKMMMFMSVFFLFMFYNMPSGLNFYIMCSNIAGILEQRHIRQHIAKEEKKGAFEVKGAKKNRFTNWMQHKWEKLQKEAEDAKRIQSDRKKK